MLWEKYYEKLGLWDTATAVSMLARLESFGPGEEIVDAIDTIGFEDERGATELLKMATAAGVKFTGEQLSELCLVCGEAALRKAILCSSEGFAAEDLEALYCCCDDALLIRIGRERRLPLPRELAEELEEEAWPHRSPGLRDVPPQPAARKAGPEKRAFLGSVPITAEQYEQLRSLIGRGDKLEAVRRIRLWTPLSLADALHIADNFYTLDLSRPQASVRVGREVPPKPTDTGGEKTRKTAKAVGKAVGLASIFGGYSLFRIVAGLVKPYMGKRR